MTLILFEAPILNKVGSTLGKMGQGLGKMGSKLRFSNKFRKACKLSKIPSRAMSRLQKVAKLSGNKQIRAVNKLIREYPELASVLKKTGALKRSKKIIKSTSLGRKGLRGRKLKRPKISSLRKKPDPVLRLKNKIPKKVPENWLIKASKNKKGIKYVNPKNSHDYIRFSSKNLDSRAPLGQKAPYFQRYLDGKALTKDGKWVIPKNHPNKSDFHIPQKCYDEYIHLLKLKQ